MHQKVLNLQGTEHQLRDTATLAHLVSFTYILGLHQLQTLDKVVVRYICQDIHHQALSCRLCTTQLLKKMETLDKMFCLVVLLFTIIQ